MRWYYWAGGVMVVALLAIMLLGGQGEQTTTVFDDLQSSPSTPFTLPVLSSGGVTRTENNSLPPELESLISGDEWVENGSEVYFDDDRVLITSTARSNTPIIRLTPKTFSGNINVAFGFNTQDVTPTAAYYNRHNETYEESYTCQGTFNYTTNPNYFWCYTSEVVLNNITQQNQTVQRLVFDHNFTHGNIPSKTAYWDEQREVWDEVSGAFTKTTFFLNNTDTWYYKQNFPVVANQTYELKLNLKPKNINIPSTKYWIAFYPSSETITQAVQNDQFYVLDPWTSDLSTNLVGYFSYDANNSINQTYNLFNASNNLTMFNGTKINGTTATSTAIIENSSFFDGTNDEMIISSNNGAVYNFADTDGFSFCFWWFPKTLGTTEQHVISHGSSGYEILQYNGAIYLELGSAQINTGNVLSTSALQFICTTYNGTSSTSGVSIYRNGVEQAVSRSGTVSNFANGVPFTVGKSGNTTSYHITGYLDEMAVFNAQLSASQVLALYNNGSGLPYVPTSISVTLNSPDSGFYNTTNSVDFNFTATPTEVNMTNYTIYLYNSTSLYTTTTVTGLLDSSETTYTNTITGIPDGNYTWNSQVCGMTSSLSTCSFASSNKTFEIALASQISIELLSPVDNYNTTTGGTLSFIGNASDNSALVNVSLFYDGTLNQTNSSGVFGNYTFNNSLSEGTHTWFFRACDDDGFCLDSATRTLIYDGTAPIITTTGNQTYTYLKSGDLVNITTAVQEANLQSCWYSIGLTGTNNSMVCNATITLNATDSQKTNTTITKTIKVYANDTLGNTGSVTVTYGALLFNDYENHETSVIEGSSSTFNLNLYTNGTDINLAVLNYNDTNYTASTLGKVGNNYSISRTINIPGVDSSQTLPFNWTISPQGLDQVIVGPYSQNVITFVLNNCTGNATEVLYNFTIVDEDSQIKLEPTTQNTTAQVDLQLYSSDRTLILEDKSFSFNETNSFAICMDTNLSGGGAFSADVQVQYDAEGYAPEFYNIRGEEITYLDFYNNITLYDLLDSRTQEFKLTYKDQYFLPVSEALVQLQRKYIGEGLFKVVELPITDSKGETLVHLVLSDVIYTINIIKDNTILATFDNVIAVCDNVATGDCNLNLNAKTSSIPVTLFNTYGPLSFTLSLNQDSHQVESVFTTRSGESIAVGLNVTKFDGFNNVSVCKTSLVGSGGTLTCPIPSTYGNTTLYSEIVVDGELAGYAIMPYYSPPSDRFGGSWAFVAIIFMLGIVFLGLSSNPVTLSITIILGLVLMIGLNIFTSAGLFGAGATILWIIVAIVVIIFKAGGRQ